VTLGTSLILDLQSRSENLPVLILRLAHLVRAGVQDRRESDMLVIAAVLYARALHESDARGTARRAHENNLVETFRAALKALNPEEM